MKNLGPWLKSNWAILVLGVIAIAALPALWFVSSGMNSKIVSDFQDRIKKDYQAVTAAKVPYGLVTPTGDKVLEANVPVNAARTAAYQKLGEELQSQTSVVTKAADQLNTDQGKHQPLIEGLFPKPTDLERLAKPKFFVRQLLQQARPALLESIHAGTPPSPTDLAAQLTELMSAKREQVRQEQGRTDLDKAEQEQMAKDLLSLRLSRYRQRAAEIQVYADASIFDKVPEDAIDKTASLAQVWDWQERYWVDADVLRAVAAANGDSGGHGVPGSVIKRIMSLAVEPPPYTVNMSDSAVEVRAYDAGADKAPTDFSRSITGRISGPGSTNKWYDIRHVTIEMVADSRRLPAFVDALASTNFMTVVDVDLTKIDPQEDLRQGFYYGDATVVKATVVIETVWFREWRTQWMPDEVKKALGMDPNAQVADPNAGASAPPPRRGGGPTPGEEGLEGGRRGVRGGGRGG